MQLSNTTSVSFLSPREQLHPAPDLNPFIPKPSTICGWYFYHFSQKPIKPTHFQTPSAAQTGLGFVPRSPNVADFRKYRLIHRAYVVSSRDISAHEAHRKQGNTTFVAQPACFQAPICKFDTKGHPGDGRKIHICENLSPTTRFGHRDDCNPATSNTRSGREPPRLSFRPPESPPNASRSQEKGAVGTCRPPQSAAS